MCQNLVKKRGIRMTDDAVKISIDTIKKMSFCGSCTTGPCNECVRYIAKRTALEALEKQLSNKVKIEQYIYTKCTCGYEFSKHVDDGFYRIPIERKTNYCPNCGQKLSWTYEDEE